MKYKFRIKENKDMGYKGIVLEDKTKLIFTKDGASLMFPKKKFKKMFELQLKDKNTHFGITFDTDEITAIIKGVKKLFKEK